MEHRRIYWNNKEGDVVVVMAETKDIDFFKGMGGTLEKLEPILQKKKDIDLTNPKPVVESSDFPNVLPGDQGSGKPGTEEFCVNMVNGFESNQRKELLQYVKDVTGKMINHRGAFDKLQKNAADTVAEFFKN